MKNIALELSYLGTNYHGWQRQSNALSIQECLELAVSQRCGEYSYVSGCGRTDAGVHARSYFANFKSNTAIPIERMHMALNSALPRDIVVKGAFYVDDDFDARFSCVAKEYTYVFYNAPLPSPFDSDRAFHIFNPLAVDAMSEAARHFVGRQDFAAVKNEGTPVSSTIREIFYCNVEKQGEYISFSVCADGFLYNMVRNIAGCLWYVGCGKLSPRYIREILDSCDRCKAGPTAPPQGLYMSRVFYDRREFELWKNKL